MSPLIAILGRAWNDALPDADRTRLLRPYIRRVAGTRCAVDLNELGVLAAFAGDKGFSDIACMPADCARAWMCADWLVRTYTVAWLRRAGRDTATLEELPELTFGTHGTYRPGDPAAVVLNAIVPEQQLARPDEYWSDGYWLATSRYGWRAAAMAGGRAVRDAFRAVPRLVPDAPSYIDHLITVATGNAEAAITTVAQAAARDTGWNDDLEAERLATLAMAREAARRARREVEQAAPAEVRRAALQAKRAAELNHRKWRKVSEGITRKSAEETARRTIGPAVRPYVWIRAKAAGWAAVRDSRKAMGQYAPPAIRDAAQAAGASAYRDVEHFAPWQPALAAAQAAAEHALAPTIAELQSSVCDLLDRLSAT